MGPAVGGGVVAPEEATCRQGDHDGHILDVFIVGDRISRSGAIKSCEVLASGLIKTHSLVALAIYVVTNHNNVEVHVKQKRFDLEALEQ